MYQMIILISFIIRILIYYSHIICFHLQKKNKSKKFQQSLLLFNYTKILMICHNLSLHFILLYIIHSKNDI